MQNGAFCRTKRRRMTLKGIIMNGRKVNWAFLISILLYIACSLGITYVFPKLAENIALSNFVVEMLVLLPGLLFVICSKENVTEFLGFRKMKLTTLLAVIPFTMFTTPFINLLNLLTQFFVENEAAGMMESYEIAKMPFVLVWFVVGLFAPFCEEVACRGVYYRGYKRSGSAFAAMLLSALLFGVVHMNLNQAVYAVAMGILSVLLVEATGSIWSSIAYHALINSSQVAIMYTALKMDSNVYSNASEMVNTDFLVYSVAIYLVITAVTLPLGWALLIWMSAREGRKGVLMSVWKSRKEKPAEKVSNHALFPVKSGRKPGSRSYQEQ